jgi:predicted CopG family antitoxin
VAIVTAKAKATTLTIRESTRRRLADYKRGDSSFDDVLNRLMDQVPLEDVMEDDIREHYERLASGEWISAEEFKGRIARMLDERRAVRRTSGKTG